MEPAVPETRQRFALAWFQLWRISRTSRRPLFALCQWPERTSRPRPKTESMRLRAWTRWSRLSSDPLAPRGCSIDASRCSASSRRRCRTRWNSTFFWIRRASFSRWATEWTKEHSTPTVTICSHRKRASQALSQSPKGMCRLGIGFDWAAPSRPSISAPLSSRGRDRCSSI